MLVLTPGKWNIILFDFNSTIIMFWPCLSIAGSSLCLVHILFLFLRHENETWECSVTIVSGGHRLSFSQSWRNRFPLKKKSHFFLSCRMRMYEAAWCAQCILSMVNNNAIQFWIVGSYVESIGHCFLFTASTERIHCFRFERAQINSSCLCKLPKYGYASLRSRYWYQRTTEANEILVTRLLLDITTSMCWWEP